jgi:triacylglycerol lipase
MGERQGKSMIRVWVAVAGLLVMAGVAGAQVPPQIAAKVRAAGHSMDPATGGDYAKMFGPPAWDGMTIVRDVAYGSDPLQKLDLFVPDTSGGNRPVLLFVHGGGFTRGDKHGPFYPDNITAWAAKHGMVGVNIDYRLAPANPWPAAVEDIAAAVAWVHANIAQYGGDPDRIVLWGHSAGANDVADYVAHPDMQGPAAASVKGAIMLSPFYAADPGPAPKHAYYGSDRELQSAPTVIAGLKQSRIPLLFADSEFDPVPFQAFVETARGMMCEVPATCPAYVHLLNRNHFTEGMSVGTSDTTLTDAIERWIREKVRP